MRNTARLAPSSRPALALALALALAACGGKIAGEDGAPGADTDGGSGSFGGASSGKTGGSIDAPAGSQQAGVPSGVPSGAPQPAGQAIIDDACETICQRNGECGAGQSDCKDRCADDLRGVTSCSAEATAYIQCYAQNLEAGCAALPPACEPAYCAYTRCAGKVVPAYCP